VSVEQEEKLPQVIYANLVSVNLSADDVLFEFWEHRTGFAGAKFETIEGVYKKTQPVARVVLTYHSAVWLRDYLDRAIPELQAKRKATTV
jgi:hypothetical protein